MNKPFEDVTEEGEVYCYERLHSHIVGWSPSEPKNSAEWLNGILLIQIKLISDGKSIQVEFFPRREGCSKENLNFVSPARMLR